MARGFLRRADLVPRRRKAADRPAGTRARPRRRRETQHRRFFGQGAARNRHGGDTQRRRRARPRAGQQNHRPQVVGIEATAFQAVLAAKGRRQAVAAGVTLPSMLIHNQVAKPLRIRRLGPALAQRRIRFNAGSWGARELVNQLRDFPIGDHDDGPDALEWGSVSPRTSRSAAARRQAVAASDSLSAIT